MSDGDYPTYGELRQEIRTLKAQMEQLEKENESLKQQLRDIQAHPIGTAKGPVHWCFCCGNPTLDPLHHVCQR